MNYPKNSALERELVASLKESASGNARAMAATIVAAGPASDAARAEELVDTLMGRRPARIVHLRTRTGAAEPFKAWASARCSLDRQNRGVCFEDVHIESADDGAADPRSWGSFVLRELPALLLWFIPLGACPDCMGDWEDKIDLVVFDGSADPASSAEPRAFARTVRAAFSEAPALADFSWERLERVRTAVARLFDPPAAALSARGIASVDVGAGDPWSRALLAGWIASRKLPGDVEVREAEGAVVSVRFSFRDGTWASADFPNGRDAVLRSADGAVLELPFPPQDDGALLASLIDAPLEDPLYAETLRFLADE